MVKTWKKFKNTGSRRPRERDRVLHHITVTAPLRSYLGTASVYGVRHGGGNFVCDLNFVKSVLAMLSPEHSRHVTTVTLWYSHSLTDLTGVEIIE
ncbi:hypothetical protein E2C01_028314 [Portunus trituberculatus]|uniref:Uncharacterized protein n=1 Tax=Portunus trituberculatus TaxID=210409 RepID=A0A5B7EK49_PORTR|nr:hypothetical protein [Portunus trituberculatus]